MKKIYTLFIMSLFAIAVIGQSEKTKSRDYHNPLKQNRFQSPENLKDNRLEFDKFRRYGQIVQKPAQFKSSRDTKQALDSSVTLKYDGTKRYKSTNVYDDEGKNTQSSSYSWDLSGNKWIGSDRDQYTYYEDGYLKTLVIYLWDYNIEDWYLNYKTEFAINTDGDLTSEETFQWNPVDEDWDKKNKKEYTFDSNGNIILYVSSNFNNNEWVPFSKSEHIYDSDGQMIKLNGYLWDDEWVNNGSADFSYDAQGNITQKIWYQWNSQENSWIPSSKYDYAFDADENMIQEIKYEWNFEANDWTNIRKLEFIYDTEGYMTEMVYTLWSQQNNTWRNISIKEYIYDNYYNLTEEKFSQWNGETNVWQISYKDVYAYNTDYMLEDLLLPMSYSYVNIPEEFSTMLLSGETLYWDDETGDWEFDGGYNLYYSEQLISDILDKESAGIKIYPNPASEFIYFEATDNTTNSTVEVFDMQGRMVLSQEISGKQQISVSHLDKGLYIYKLVQNGKPISGKIMIE